MMMFATIFMACGIILVMYVALRVLNWIWLSPRKLELSLRQQGFSGNPYRFLLGDTRDCSRMNREQKSKPMIKFSHDYFHKVDPFLHRTVENHGKRSFHWVGPVLIVNITEPELIREVLQKMENFPKIKLNPLFTLLFPGLTSYEGKKWAYHRKLLNPAFHMEKLKLMLPAFYMSCEEMMSKWEKMTDQVDSAEVDVWPYLVTLTADVISRAAFSSSYEEGRRIFQLLKEQIQATMQSSQFVYIPGYRHLPTELNRTIKVTDSEIQSLLKGMIEKRMKEMEAGGAAKDDLLGMLMDSGLREERDDREGPNRITIEEIIGECKLFYFAGQETTASLLVWTILMLSKHHDWQERARQEVVKIFGNNKPDFDGLSQLKTVTMILQEVLRLYPPVVQVRRTIPKDTKLGDLCLPKGTFLSLLVLVAHQDNQLWGDDAKEFKPERFSEGILNASKGNKSFFPFGWGPRICLGQNFAMVEAKLALAMILQCFSFRLSSTYTHAPQTAPLLQPKFGAPIILHRLPFKI